VEDGERVRQDRTPDTEGGHWSDLNVATLFSIDQRDLIVRGIPDEDYTAQC